MLTTRRGRRRDDEAERRTESRKRIREFLALLDRITASGSSEFGGPHSQMLEPDFDLVIQAARTTRLTSLDFYALDTRPGDYGHGSYPDSFWKLRQTRNGCDRFRAALVPK